MLWWSKWWATRTTYQRPSVEEVRKGHSWLHVCVREKRECVCYPLWCCLMDHICCLTSALGQRAKVISLSQPKVSGKARNPSRGTVGPAHLPPLPFLPNQSEIVPGSVGVNAVSPRSVFCLEINDLMLPAVLIRGLLCMHAAAAALTSSLSFHVLILWMSTATSSVALFNEAVDGCATGIDRLLFVY